MDRSGDAKAEFFDMVEAELTGHRHLLGGQFLLGTDITGIILVSQLLEE